MDCEWTEHAQRGGGHVPAAGSGGEKVHCTITPNYSTKEEFTV
jgi:hypothetical protein